MPADDHRKVEDALQAIRSLVEASGIEASDDDGVLQLDAIVWKGTPNQVPDEEPQADMPLQMFADPVEAPFEPILDKSWADTFAPNSETLQSSPIDAGEDHTSHFNGDDGGDAFIAPVEPLPVIQADVAQAPVATDGANDEGLSRNFAFSDEMRAFQDKGVEAISQDAYASTEIRETRALLAEFQSLLDSTIALRNAQNQPSHSEESLPPVTNEISVTNADDDRGHSTEKASPNLSEMAQAALDARSYDTAPLPNPSDEDISQSPSPVTSAPSKDAGIDVVTSRPAAAPDEAVYDLQAASMEAASSKLSKIALHLVDAPDTSEDEKKSLFTSAVRSTMQDIIRGQMTDWLSANMTDIIEDALRDEMRPAKPKNPKSSNRQDRNS